MSIQVKVKVLPNGEGLPLPSHVTPNSAAVCLYAANDIEEDILIMPADTVAVPTGISLEFPPQYSIDIMPLPEVSYIYALTVLNAPGTIDADYRGEIKVILINFGSKAFMLRRGMIIAHMTMSKILRMQLI